MNRILLGVIKSIEGKRTYSNQSKDSLVKKYLGKSPAARKNKR